MISKDLGAAEEALTIGGGLGAGRVIAFQLAGTFDATVTFEATVDGTNYVAIGAFPVSESGTASTTATTAGIYRVRSSGVASVRARCSTYASGTIEVAVETCEGTL